MTIDTLLSELKEKNIRIVLNEGSLKIKAPDGALTPELIGQIKTHKPEIVRFLEEMQPSDSEGAMAKAQQQEYYELTSGQYRFFMLQNFNNESTAYNMPSVIKLEGKMDSDRIESAFLKLIDRHENLRTSFHLINETPVQKIHEHTPFKLSVKSCALSELDEIAQDFIQPFDLGEPCLIRAEHILTEKDEYLLMDIHHIINDGVSQQILQNEFSLLYQGADLDPVQYRYVDYVASLQTDESLRKLKKQGEYWRSVYETEPAPLEFPCDFKRPVVQSFQGLQVDVRFTAEEYRKIQAICTEHDLTPYMALTALFSVWISKLTGSNDVVLGSPVSGRERLEVQDIFGLFINTLAIRNTPESSKKIKEYLAETRMNLLAAFENQEYPFADLVENVLSSRTPGRNPLFDVLFSLQQHNLSMPKTELSQHQPTSAKVDLTLEVNQFTDGMQLTVSYATDLFQAKTIERFLGYFKSLLNAISLDSEQTIGTLSLLNEEEQQAYLKNAHSCLEEFPSDKTVIALFENQVEKTPDNSAIEFGELTFSYDELNAKVNRFARFLQKEYSIQEEELVAVQLDRNEWFTIAILAILKLGGAYVPIDTSYPEERIQFILDDCQSQCVITADLVRAFQEEEMTFSSENPNSIGSPQHLAYVIYTSGSTGKPKGVLIEQQSIVRLVKNTNFYDSSNSRVFGLSNYAFDAATFEFYMPLLNGGTMVIASKDLLLNPMLFGQEIENRKIDGFFITSTLFNTILDENPGAFKTTKQVLVGGEKVSASHFRKFVNLYPEIKLQNGYGPTENTTFSTWYQATSNEEGDSIPIGHPISNSPYYVVDAEGNLVPEGVVGELWVGGPGVARGYLNREALTAEKFAQNPFGKGRVYKTGDLCRYSQARGLDFLGRIDDQVKIRGHRIELGEIEQQLIKYADVHEAVVLVKEYDDGHKSLIGFVTPESGTGSVDIQMTLRKELPEYMIPESIVRMSELPHTPNGKIDHRKLLSSMEEYHSENQIIVPQNEMEEQLLAWWKDLLKKDTFGVTDNFFSLGGHSLMITKLLSRIYNSYGVAVSVAEMYRHTTIREIARLIEIAEKTQVQHIPKAPQKESYPLAPSQHRLYMIHQFAPQSLAYNMPMPILLKGEVDVAHVEGVLRSLIQRHESLRTSFVMENGVPVQRILPEFDFKLEHTSASEDDLEAIQKDFVRPFVLSEGPLIRAKLIELTNDFVLLLDMHHIVNDGVSQNILEKEFTGLFEGKELTPVAFQFKDYSEWLGSAKQQETLKEQETYWLSEFSGSLPVLDLPTDFERPEHQTFEGRSVTFRLTDEEQSVVDALREKYELTSFMALVALVNIWLSKLSGDEDIIIGSPIAGRQHKDLEEIVGVFINTIALRNYPESGKSLDDFFREVKENVVQSFANQDYPFEKLVDKSLAYRDQSRSPLFDVLLVMQNQNESFELDHNFLDRQHREELTKFDLSIEVFEVNGAMHFSVGYATKLFLPETIDRFVSYFRTMISGLKSAPKRLAELNLLPAGEKELLLHEFNDTAHEFPTDKTLVDLFYDRVEQTPEAIALVFQDKKFTFKELDDASSRLAAFLRQSKGVNKTDLVAVKLSRGEWMIISILAVVKLGAAYVPISPDYPEARIRYMEENSKCHTTISAELIREYLDSGVSYGSERPGVLISPMDLAYVIYTSGSTGNPKGCKLNHLGVVNRIDWMWDALRFQPGETVLQKTAFTFDVSVWEIFLPLCWGNTMVVCTEEDVRSPKRLLTLIEQHHVNTMHFVPSMFKAFISELKDSGINEIASLQRIITSGEALPLADVRDWHGLTNVPLHNLYGPTEASIDVSYYTTTGTDRHIPIGKPIWNTILYVLDDHLNLVPMGSRGEICIGGVGLSTGYLNNPALTEEKFVDSPFEKGKKIYRTGDIGKWTADGQLLYLDRKDSQVKIRGYRVELGEIENALRTIPGVEEAAVLTKENESGEKTLSGYVVLSQPLTVQSLKATLAKELPEFMVPGLFYQVLNMPLSPNGKLDRKVLSATSSECLLKDEQFVGATTETQRQLIEVWEEVLEQENIGVTDSFFELGGDSIKVLRMSGVIKAKLGLEIDLQTLYKNDTIFKMASFIENNEAGLKQASEENTILRDEVLSEIESIKQEVLASPQLSEPERIEDVFPMSAIEKGMIFESVLSQAEGVYHDQAFYQRVFEDFDFDLFRKAFELLVNKHAILRSAYNLADFNSEVHLVYSSISLPLDFKDISWLSQEEQTENIKAYMEDGLKNPFDTSQAPLWRMRVFQLDRHVCGFAWQFHHAILDGWSNASLITELNNIYFNLKESQDYVPEPLKSDYKDFVVEALIDRKNEGLTTFWKNEMKGYTRLDLFTQTDHVSNYSGALSQERLKALEATASSIGVSVKTMAFGAYLELLNVLNVENEIVTGLVTNTRPGIEDGDKILGCFLNTIPFRLDTGSKSTVQEFIHKVNNKINLLKDKERLELLEIAKITGENSTLGSPFFDVIFNYVDFHIYNRLENGDVNQDATEGINADRELDWEKTNTVLDFTVNKTGGLFNVSMTLSRELKSGISGERLIELYYTILNYFVDCPSGPLYEIELLNPEEKQQLESFNETYTQAKVAEDFNVIDSIQNHKSLLHQRFEMQAANNPDAVALILEDASMTYGELNLRSNQLAHFLRENGGVGREMIVGLILDRSFEMLISILGVLKSGGTYLPIDPDYPQERINYTLEDSACSVVLTKESFKELITTDALVIAVDSTDCSVYSAENPQPINETEDRCYIIYTSGSTGKPKGVQISHHNVFRLLFNDTNRFDFSEKDTWSLFHSYCFDFSVWEMYGALLLGGKLVIVPKTTAQDAVAFVALAAKEKVTVLNQTPGAFYNFVEAETNTEVNLESIRYVIFGGEALHPVRLKSWNEKYPNSKLVNMYGITETTVHVTYKEIGEKEIASGISNIGVPIPTLKCYVLDQHQRLVPLGVSGELCVSGEGLSKGYLNREELTAEKFIPHPFFEGEKLYRSGDLARWLPNGELEYMGRIDYQVKIRGFRIELGEVEAAINAVSIVNQAAVICHTSEDGSNRLVAYVIGDSELSVNAIREELVKTIPEYMIPAQFVQLEALPVTSNGKIDRKNLPLPDGAGMKTGNDYVAPSGKVESEIVSIWAEVLEIKPEQISTLDNFFEIGGDSIRLLKVFRKLQDRLEQEVSVAQLFQFPTIEKLAIHLESHEGSNAATEEMIEESKEVLFDSMKLLLNDDE